MISAAVAIFAILAIISVVRIHRSSSAKVTAAHSKINAAEASMQRMQKEKADLEKGADRALLLRAQSAEAKIVAEKSKTAKMAREALGEEMRKAVRTSLALNVPRTNPLAPLLTRASVWYPERDSVRRQRVNSARRFCFRRRHRRLHHGLLQFRGEDLCGGRF